MSDEPRSSKGSRVSTNENLPDEDQQGESQVEAYLEGKITLEDTVKLLVGPVNTAYTSAESFTDEDAPSAESELWGLWGEILGHARATPWDDPRQKRLVDLVQALHSQPDPKRPEPMTAAIKKNWVYADGAVWSDLSLFGPSTREDWNDSPGCGIGFEDADIHAWTNVNAFIARVTAEEVRDFWMYAIWALRDGLEDDLSHSTSSEQVSKSTKLNALVPAAAVWVLILGKSLYDREDDLTPTERRFGDPGRPGKLLGGRSEFSKRRWGFWKQRFAAIRDTEDVSQETRDFAAAAYSKMDEVEKQP